MSSSQADMMAVASLPLLAPNYLNFLTKIVPVAGITKAGACVHYDVWVHYRSIVKTRGRVEHSVDAVNQIVTLHHDGPLVRFEANFRVASGNVLLDCTYRAKLPLGAWIIAKVLDRTLGQVAAAMDRYAAARTWGPR